MDQGGEYGAFFFGAYHRKKEITASILSVSMANAGRETGTKGEKITPSTELTIRLFVTFGAIASQECDKSQSCKWIEKSCLRSRRCCGTLSLNEAPHPAYQLAAQISGSSSAVPLLDLIPESSTEVSFLGRKGFLHACIQIK